MSDFLTSLFSTDDFPARWQCGNWSDLHGWTHIISDLAILVAYLTIASILLYTLIRIKRVPYPFPRLLALFAAFIIACGITHLNEALIFWHPFYRFAAVIKVLTAIVSVATVVALIPALPRVFVLRTPSDLVEQVQRATTDLRKERDAARRFAALVDSSNDAIITYDEQGDILTWNRTAEQLLGYTAEEAIGNPISMLCVSGNSFAFPTTIPKDASGNRVVQLNRKNGAPLPISLTISPIYGHADTVLGISVIARDLTERMDHVEALSRAERLFRIAVDASPSGMVATDADGRIVLLNNEAERLFGYSKQELMNQSIEILIPKPYRKQHPNHRVAYESAPESRAMGAGRELFALRKDGTSFPVEIGLNPIETEDGPVTLCAVVDRTEVVQKQKSLEQAIQDLKSKTIELGRSNAELEQFAYVSSHDLKAPLRGIQNAVTWIEEDLPKEQLSAEMLENLQLLTSRAARMDDMIDGLLSYAKAGQMADKLESIQTKSLVQDVIELTNIDTEMVTVTIAEDMPTINSFRIPLEHVFSNLIENANKHREQKAITISISAEIEDDMVAFFVRDDGPGIDPTLHKKVFQIFQTVKPKDEMECTGLGLALVKKLVENYGGTIGIQPGQTMGCTFRFTWPMCFGNEKTEPSE